MSMRKTTKGKGTIAKIKGIKKGIKKKRIQGTPYSTIHGKITILILVSIYWAASQTRHSARHSNYIR